MAAKPKVERCKIDMTEVWAEREQHNKQGSMEEYDHQLYRRPQMTGQAKDEEDHLGH